MFIDKYLISDVEEHLFSDGTTDVDQMRYEKHLRSVVAERDVEYPADLDYTSWCYDYKHGAVYVDRCGTYTQPTRIAFDAVTEIVSDENRTLEMILWTYGAAAVFINGKKVCEHAVPQYKPIIMRKFNVELKKGANEVFVHFQNLGVRDGRNLFGLEIPHSEGIENTIPPVPCRDEYLEASRFLDDVVISWPDVIFTDGSMKVQVGYEAITSAYSRRNDKVTWHDATGVKAFRLDETVRNVIVKVEVAGKTFRRKFECLEAAKREVYQETDFDRNFKRILEDIASRDGQSRAGGKFGFFIPNILARKALGINDPDDRDRFLVTLQQMEDSYDCSDFLLSGVIRYMKNYEMDADLRERTEKVLFGYRYWMTMEGSDAMCFWSENHALLFYSSAMLVGDMYPDAYFTKAGMKGSELHEFGRRLTSEWLDDLEEYGFEEFNSTVYMNITFVSLLNIVDYGDEEISERARKVTDLLLKSLALHSFKGAVISPMGRVYRGIVYPPSQGAQGLLNLCCPELPYNFGEGWLSYYFTSSYRFPTDILQLASDPVETEYSTGNALVRLYKKDNAVLTSVQCPRLDGFRRWENVTLREDTDSFIGTHAWTKSFNERFHGTTYFEPGVFGYQQHMWCAALDNEAILFVNNPGVPSDAMSMRPGYWYGNGVMPQIRQESNILGIVYDIPETYPMKFTHVFLPECKYDEILHDGSWIFLRKDKGYMALWSSDKLEKYDDVLFNAELRSYSLKSAYVCVVGENGEYASFDDFQKKVSSMKPSFDSEDMKLSISGEEYIRYEAHADRTQYV